MTERELFKEAVMQYMVDDAQVRRAGRKQKMHRTARRILFAAACLVAVMGITVVAVPSARAAVEDWISDLFTARGYFGQEKSERTEEPTIEAITTQADGSAPAILNVGAGYEAYAEAFDMKLDEIAYDGTSIFLSGTMSGATARPFVQGFTGGDTYRYTKNDGSLDGDPNWKYYLFECENVVLLKTADGGEYIGNITPNITNDMQEIIDASADDTSEPDIQEGKLITTNPLADKLWDKYLADHDVRFSVELLKVYWDMEPLTGMVDGELSLRLFYGNVEGADAIQVLQANFGKITIDANAYQAQTQTTQAKSETTVDLGGTHPVTILEWQPEEERTGDTAETYYYTHELDFTGASYSLKEISFTPTDTKITLHIVLPESWTAAERCYCDLSFRFLLDGEAPESWSGCPFNTYGPMGTADKTGKTLEYDFELFSSSLSPSQWADIKTITILPATTYWWDMKVTVDDGPQQDISLRDGAVYTSIVYDESKPSGHGTTLQTDPQYDVMSQYALTIDLDDYR